MTLDGYHWTWKSDTDTDYETLIRPDGSEVTTITEPEDRVSYRDLEPVTAELNSLIAKLRAAEAVVEASRYLKGHVGTLRFIVEEGVENGVKN